MQPTCDRNCVRALCGPCSGGSQIATPCTSPPRSSWATPPERMQARMVAPQNQRSFACRCASSGDEEPEARGVREGVGHGCSSRELVGAYRGDERLGHPYRLTGARRALRETLLTGELVSLNRDSNKV